MRSFQAEISDLRGKLNRVTNERDALIKECGLASAAVINMQETYKDLNEYMSKYKRMDKFIAWQVVKRMEK